MKYKSRYLALLILSFLGLFSLTVANVQAVPYTYTYTGNNFTEVTPPYTTANFISGSVTLSQALPSNLNGTPWANSLVVSYSFTDGIQIISGGAASANDIFQFFTDANGIIINWDVRIAGLFATPHISATYCDYTEDIGQLSADGASGENYNMRGTWTVAAAPAGVPDSASTAGLLGIAVAGLFLVRRRLVTPAVRRR